MAYASLDDINSYLPDNVITADDINIKTIDISVVRIINSYLASIFTVTTWVDPESTPDTVREIAALLAASQLYFAETSATSLDIDVRNFGQILYDRAILMLQSIVDGSLVVPGGSTNFDMSFYPDKDASLAFTTDMQFS